MRTSRCLLVVMLLAVAPLARADLVQWHVEGAITRVGEELAPGQPLGPDSAAIADALAGIGVQVGAPWSADLSFDSSAAPYTPAWSPSVTSFSAITGFSVSAGAFSGSSSTGGVFSPYGSGPGPVTARSDSGSFSLTFDADFLSSLFGELFPFEGVDPFRAKLVLVGAPADLLPGDSLPSDPPALELLGSGSGFFITSELQTPSVLATFGVEGSITELQRVPEPAASSAALLGALSVLLGRWKALRRALDDRATARLGEDHP
jgi:hypothetical protein